MWLCASRNPLFYLRMAQQSVRVLGKPKVFCIGANKTGTTSMKKALRELGYIVGDQRPAELLIHDWAKRDFRRLFRFCHTAQAFQDVPFSWSFTFQALDQYFPGSKFILTVRDSPDQWYRSLVSFQAKVFGNGITVTKDDLRRSDYVYPGWAYEAVRLNWDTPEDDIYHKDILIAGYNAHNAAVQAYFRHRPKDLLILNVGQAGAYQALCDFLGKPCPQREFPWENRTADVKGHPESAKKENG